MVKQVLIILLIQLAGLVVVVGLWLGLFPTLEHRLKTPPQPDPVVLVVRKPIQSSRPPKPGMMPKSSEAFEDCNTFKHLSFMNILQPYKECI